MNDGLPAFRPIDIIRVLRRNGFRLVTRRKRHRVYTDGARIVVVPYHPRNLKPRTLHSIISQAGWTEEEFLRRL